MQALCIVLFTSNIVEKVATLITGLWVPSCPEEECALFIIMRWLGIRGAIEHTKSEEKPTGLL